MTIWSAEIKELEQLHESLKRQFPELGKELEQLIRTEDANVVMLYSRRCLEIIITDLCECELRRPRKTEPLKGIIDKLSHEGKVPSHIIASMEGLNSLSTFGAHPKEFDPRQVKPVLNNLTTIIEWYLKYKDAQKFDKTKPEEVKYESKVPDAASDKSTKSKRKLIIVSAGLVLVILITIGVLLISNIIGGQNKTKPVKELAKSIAVLPFQNYSGDPDQEYMSDGLTDEIINHLFKIASFDKVVSLSTVLTYKGTDKRLPQIADELKVNYILEGTYKKIGDQVRVTAQLIEPKNDKHLWQNEYDQPYKEIIAIQADIALQIADQVKAFITSSEKQNIQKIPTTNNEAYQLLQQGLYLWNTRSFDSLNQLIDLGLKAIALDPNFADGYAWIGSMILVKGGYSGASEMQSVIWDATSYFDKALELDPDNSGAHLGLALFNEWIKWDYIKAEKELQKAIELLPNSPLYYEGYIEFLIKRNRPKDALAYLVNIELQSGLQTRFDVLSGELSGNKNEVYNSINTYLKSNLSHTYPFAGEQYLWLQEYDSAKLYLESALQSEDQYMFMPRFQACLALAYHKTNNYQQAQTIISSLINKSNETSAGSPDYFIGWYYSGIGETDSAFYWLEKAYYNRSPEMAWLKVDPAFNNLKNNDRYWDLYERTGHKAYDEYYEKTRKK